MLAAGSQPQRWGGVPVERLREDLAIQRVTGHPDLDRPGLRLSEG